MSQLHSGGEHSRKLAQAILRRAKENYGRLIAAARKEWERKFAGSDPSDACVTVRISAGDSREMAKFFPFLSSRRLEPFLTN
jgi:hypothetical protein